MTKDPDWVFDKAIDLTAATMAGRAGQGQPPEYTAQVFREVWNVLKEAANELPDKPRTGFGAT